VENKKIPAAAKIFTAATEGRVQFSNTPPWMQPAIVTSYFPISKKRALLNPSLAPSIFNRLIEDKPKGHIAIFTDGSVDPREESASSAFVIPQLGITWC